MSPNLRLAALAAPGDCPATRRALMRVTDWGMIAYWLATTLAAVGLLDLPAAWLFKDYHLAHSLAWNWSFLPLDLAFAATGLIALRLERRGDARWRGWAIVSLTLTAVAGGMAIAYWSLSGAFDPTWWAMNLFLLLWPLPILAGLLAEDA